MRAIALNLLLLIFLVPFSGCTSPALQEDESEPCSGLDNNPKLFPRVTEYCVTQEVEGELINRRFLIQAPSVVNESASYPLLFVLGGMPDEFVGQFRDMTDAGEFVGVYPEGLERSWNLGREASNANDTWNQLLQSKSGINRITSQLFPNRYNVERIPHKAYFGQKTRFSKFQNGLKISF